MLEEKEKENEAINRDAEELVDLVRTKNGVVADLQKSLQEAKATIVELKEEVQRLRRQQTDQNAEDEPTRDQSQNRVSTNSLATIHQRYEEVLSVLQENSCSMANAFRLSGCPRSTLRDFVAIAELKIIDRREHDRVLSDWRSGSVRELEAACRRRLKRHLPVVADMRREGKLLPLKFDERFYDWTVMFKNNGSFRSHQVCKSQWSIMKSLLLIKQ